MTTDAIGYDLETHALEFRLRGHRWRLQMLDEHTASVLCLDPVRDESGNDESRWPTCEEFGAELGVQLRFVDAGDHPDHPEGVYELRHTRITIEPGKMGGVPCIRGTRMPVATVCRYVDERVSAAEICKLHPTLDLQDVRAALLYRAAASGDVATIKVDYENNAETWWDAARARAAHDPRFAEVFGALAESDEWTGTETQCKAFVAVAETLPGWFGDDARAGLPLVVEVRLSETIGDNESESTHKDEP